MTSNHTDIICPHCHKSFTIDESEYANLLNQISKQEIAKEVQEKLAVAEREKTEAVKLATLQANTAAERKAAEKDHQLLQLQSALDQAKTAQELAVARAVAQIERERDRLATELKAKDNEQKTLELSLKDKYESALKFKDDEIDRLKDMKMRLSTKMIGETLEQHCETEFNKLRPTAFQNAYFAKDNTVSKTSGSKGDYIYREADASGNEIISIMFEMKNENETTATKHKNEHFFKELDKDRREKNCEYAVLVSMLEADSELYNDGIVDVSFQSGFEKMYVIRPQFFIPIITLLRNAALNSLRYKAELAQIREQNVDVTDFEDRIAKWKGSFGINSDRATKNFNKAIKEIEASIDKLEKTRDALIQTVKNFETANKKLDDLTIKKLTRGNPTMTEKFAALDAKKSAET